MSAETKVRELLSKAFSAIQAGRPGEAIAPAEQAIKLAPENSDCHLVLATACQNANEQRKAEHHYIESLRLKPEQPRALINLGILKLSTGHGAEAIVAFKSAKQLDPKTGEASYLLANAYGVARNFNDAIAEFQRLLMAFPGDAGAMLGLAKARLSAGLTQEALATLVKAKELNPDDENVAAALQEMRTSLEELEALKQPPAGSA